VIVGVVRVVVDRARRDVVERPRRRPRDRHADLARLLEVGVAQPPLGVRVRTGGVEQEVLPGPRVVVDLRRPEPVVAPLVRVVRRQGAAGELLPGHQVRRPVDREVVARVGAVGRVRVVRAAVLEHVRVGRRQRRVVEVRRQAGAQSPGGAGRPAGGSCVPRRAKIVEIASRSLTASRGVVFEITTRSTRSLTRELGRSHAYVRVYAWSFSATCCSIASAGTRTGSTSRRRAAAM
jgi:hypothetical protein